MEIVLRSAALKANLNRYFTGKPCKHGHIAPRTIKRGECVKCKNIKDVNRKIKLEEWIRRSIFRIKTRSSVLGVPFDLDVEYLLSIWTGICPVFGTKLQYQCRGKNVPSKNQVQLDRVIPEQGYVKGNVVFISAYANRIKSNATYEDIYSVYIWLKQFTSLLEPQ